MPTKWLKFADIKERGIIDNHVTLKRRIAEDGFPSGRWFGKNDRRFPEDEVEAWLASRPSIREHEQPANVASMKPAARRKRVRTIQHRREQRQLEARA
jgi:hypothetical protein